MTVKQQNKKIAEYTMKIEAAIAQMFDEGSEQYISPEDVTEGDNASLFIHALTTVAPTMLYNRLTSSNVNFLEFNHIANTLCFQFLEIEK